MLSVMAANSTSLLISWMAPVLEEQEGILESYSLSCSLAENEDKSSLISETVELFVTVHNLQPYTAYICCLFATTSVGVSGTVCQTQNTPEDSKSESTCVYTRHRPRTAPTAQMKSFPASSAHHWHMIFVILQFQVLQNM